MLRAIQLSLAGITFLGAASVGVLALASNAEPQPTTAGLAASEAPRTLPVAAPPRIAPLSPAAAPAPAAAVAPQPERDAFANWSDEVAKLPADVGRMGPSLKLGLDTVRSNDMAFCFRELEDGGRGSRATDLMLYLEVREDAVDVVDAKIARPGALPPSVVECARDVLRGLEVKVYFATPGQRFSFIYEIEA